ncbi:27 kDa hemolymph protein-like [Vanessa cardui]|uniref:27 kDa hemolymph protein-like n=1 Tax=Vanessa cardui TaxID=171605 RepID=UPI001F1390B7|nr:27 kDa hemolymph protein-like [Vanessa cardui]
MIWKTVLLALFAVGVLAEYKVTEEHRQQMKAGLTAFCRGNGAEDKVDEVEAKVTSFVECVKALIDVETIKKEVEEAKPNGALDEVFKKYCEKSPQLKTCIHTLTNGLSPCMGAALRDHIGMANNGSDQLIDFVCHKDGDRIALFIAEGGPECIQEKVNEVRECFMKVKENIQNVEEFKKMTLVEKCTKYDEFSACAVKALEGCSTPTPGNMAESLFRFVRKGTPCAKKDA